MQKSTLNISFFIKIFFEILIGHFLSFSNGSQHFCFGWFQWVKIKNKKLTHSGIELAGSIGLPLALLALSFDIIN